MVEKLVSPRRYETPTDASTRLDGTYLRYQNEVVFVKHYDGMKFNVSSHLPDSKFSSGKLVDASSEDLDISSIPLGFLSGPFPSDLPIIVRRAPVRKYKQGIHPSNIVIEQYTIGGDPTNLGSRAISSLFGTTPFVKMLENKYSSYLEALKTVSSNTGHSLYSCAFSKEFTLFFFKGRTIVLDAFFEEVGEVTDGVLKINEWWYTPTMHERLQGLNVSIDHAY